MSKTILEPLPKGYYYFFWLFESLVLSILSGIISLLDANSATEDIIPKGIEVQTEGLGRTVRGKTIVHTLAVFMLFEGFIMLNLYPIIKNKLADRPEVQEQMVKVIQGILFVADIILLSATTYHLPSEVLHNPSTWTFNIKANMAICPALIVIRGSWLAGFGRPAILCDQKTK